LPYHDSFIYSSLTSTGNQHTHLKECSKKKFSYLITKEIQMRLLHLLVIVASGSTRVLAKVFTPICTPSTDHETCLLYWLTNTGVDLNLNNADDLEAWAHATIYSPNCMNLGSTSNGLGNNVKIDTWGLSVTDPVVLSPAVVEGVPYDTPKFSYNGQDWGYSDCQCETADLKQGIHVCKCPFQCTVLSGEGPNLWDVWDKRQVRDRLNADSWRVKR
jgi:hypothetical protein